jgi:hypothetical protein
MDQQEMTNVQRQNLQQVGVAPRPIDPRASYDGQMFLADLQYVKRHIEEPVVFLNQDGLVTQTAPIPTQPNYFYQPTMPNVFK